MKNHIWVVEGRFGKQWTSLLGVETRLQARWCKKHTYPHLKTRIRKYVPA